MDSRAKFRRLTVYYSISLTLLALLWFGFFCGVAVAGVPIPFMFLLALDTIAAAVLASMAPIDPESSNAQVTLLAAITMNLICLLVTMSGLIFAIAASSRGREYLPGVLFSGISFGVHICGAIAFVGRSPPDDAKDDIEKMKDEHRKMRELKQEMIVAKEEDQFAAVNRQREKERNAKARERQLRRDEALDEELENIQDRESELHISQMRMNSLRNK